MTGRKYSFMVLLATLFIITIIFGHMANDCFYAYVVGLIVTNVIYQIEHRIKKKRLEEGYIKLDFKCVDGEEPVLTRYRIYDKNDKLFMTVEVSSTDYYESRKTVNS